MKRSFLTFGVLLAVAGYASAIAVGGCMPTPTTPKPCGCEAKKCPDPNEEYIFSTYGDATCQEPKPRTCDPVYACRCKPGFVRQGTKCIKLCDCPSPCSDPYEEYITATVGELTCDGSKPPPCLPVKECRCISGFVRHQGKCIRISECPSKCKDPNEVYIFTKYEDETCDGGQGQTCEPDFACRCKYGYVRHQGVCIKKCQCPSKCPDKEEWVVAEFGEETCDGNKPNPCARVEECRCIKGYVRHNGKCIRRCDCPPKCKDPNEIYIFTKVGEKTCDGREPDACFPVKECRCRDGYVRHEGKCIKECDCPPKCTDPFEEYVFTKYGDATCDAPKPKACEATNACRCIYGYVRHQGKCIKRCECPPKCSDPNEVLILTKYEDETCDGVEPPGCAEVQACRCRKGYVRHEGKCIKRCSCPPKCKDPFEEYVLAQFGEPTCDLPQPDPCTPVRECRCIPGYVRHQGKCIKPCSCPPKCTDPNEIFITTKYEDETCDGEEPAGCVEVQACRCRRGYVRHEGKCIKKCNCPSKCNDPFEEYVLSRYGEPTCDLPKPNPCNPVKECRCIPGYVRHEGKCIKPCSCPPKCTDVNEIYVVTKYEDATCDKAGAPLPAEITACRCRRGYVRHEGKCIKQCDCPPKCNDPFEELITTTEGEATCDNYPDPPDSCTPVTECRCIEGYVRHNGKCIKPCSCPPKCPQDPIELLVVTDKGEKTCDGWGPRPAGVVKECRCRPGYVRNNGICIRQCDCPPKCKGANEEYMEAFTEEETCANENPSPCNPVKGCRCIEGFVRHNGVCIKKCDCPPKCTGQNEEFVKTRYTEPTCDDRVSERCGYVEECRCASGFVRHQGKCIKPCDCPPKCKDPNEEYIWTSIGERTCGEPTPAPCTRVKECRCVEGFVRHEGKCIRSSQCPCGPNEVYSDCVPLVQESCKSPEKKCIKGCKPGCMCLPGFVRNCDNKCIRLCEC